MAKTNLTQEFRAIFDNYTDEIVDAVVEVLDDVAKEAVADLKVSSPKKTGKYAKGWKADNEKGRTFAGVVVHNSRYQLTHLLENGHARRGGGREIPGIEHIGPANERAQESAVKKIEEAIRRIR